MKKLFDYLVSNKLTISFAESMTGGLLSYSLTKYPGSSKVFKGSIVSYSKETKVNILKVNESLIDKYSIVSSNVSIAMAKGLKDIINSDIYVSVTGNAGPSYESDTNALECFITILINDLEKTIHHIFIKEDSRETNILNTINIIEETIINI